MKEFDKAIKIFEAACQSGTNIHNFYGAAYRTRMEKAFLNIKRVYEEACRTDDKELGKK